MFAPGIAHGANDDAAAIRQRVRANLYSPPAGGMASKYRMLVNCNTVGGTNIGIPLPPALLNRIYPMTTRRHFTGIIMQLALNAGICVAEVTALQFLPGSIQLVGARNEFIIYLACHTLVDLYRSHGLAAHTNFISIDNRVASGDMGFHMELERLGQSMLGWLTVYKPELFPGRVCCRMKDDGKAVTIMVFQNGKIMALGINDAVETNEDYLTLCAIASQYRLDENSARLENKGRGRTARNINQKTGGSAAGAVAATAAAVPGAGRGSHKTGARITSLVKHYLENNRHRMHDTDFAQNMQAEIERLIEQAVNPAKKVRGGKRRAAVSAGGEATAAGLNDETTTATAPRKRRAKARAAPSSEAELLGRFAASAFAAVDYVVADVADAFEP